MFLCSMLNHKNHQRSSFQLLSQQTRDIYIGQRRRRWTNVGTQLDRCLCLLFSHLYMTLCLLCNNYRDDIIRDKHNKFNGDAHLR